MWHCNSVSMSHFLKVPLLFGVSFHRRIWLHHTLVMNTLLLFLWEEYPNDRRHMSVGITQGINNNPTVYNEHS